MLRTMLLSASVIALIIIFRMVLIMMWRTKAIILVVIAAEIDEKHKDDYFALLNNHGKYLAMVFDPTMWTFNQTFPFLIARIGILQKLSELEEVMLKTAKELKAWRERIEAQKRTLQ